MSTRENEVSEGDPILNTIKTSPAVFRYQRIMHSESNTHLPTEMRCGRLMGDGVMGVTQYDAEGRRLLAWECCLLALLASLLLFAGGIVDVSSGLSGG